MTSQDGALLLSQLDAAGNLLLDALGLVEESDKREFALRQQLDAAKEREAELRRYEKMAEQLTKAMAGWGWSHCTTEREMIDQIDVVRADLLVSETENEQLRAEIETLEQTRTDLIRNCDDWAKGTVELKARVAELERELEVVIEKWMGQRDRNKKLREQIIEMEQHWFPPVSGDET